MFSFGAGEACRWCEVRRELSAVPGSDGLAKIINDAVDDAYIVLPAYDY
jgi:hypothetical protein